MKDLYIGLDIGGTYVRVLAVENLGAAYKDLGKVEKNNLVSYKYIETEIERNICRSIDDYLRNNHEKSLKGIGVSLAASLNIATGKIIAWPNRKSWIGFNLKSYLENRYQTEVKIEDDANCGALGEYYYSKNRSLENLLYISLGTGIGCGIIINGKLFKGDHGFAGELGHTIVQSDSTCVCGQTGCLQAAKRNSQYIIDQVALAVYNLTMILDISKIVVGGGAIIEPFFLDEILSIVNERLYYFNRSIKILPSKYKDNSSILGALYLLC